MSASPRNRRTIEFQEPAVDSQRLEHLLSYPYALSPEDKAYFDPILAATIANLHETRQKIDQYQKELKILRKSLPILETKHRQLQYLYAPIRKLPAEILSHILSLRAQELDINATTLPADLRSFTRVSKLWQDVCLSTPQLWKALRLCWNSNTLAPAYIAQHLKLALKRSGGLPVSLHFYVLNARRRGTWKQLAEYVTILRDHAPGRICTLRLVVEGANPVGAARVLEHLKKCVRQVRELEVDFGGLNCGFQENGANLIKKVHKACPNLVSLSVEAQKIPLSHVRGASGFFTSLVNLELTYIPVDTALAAMSACKSTLVSARIHAIVSYDSHLHDFGDVHLCEKQKLDRRLPCILPDLTSLSVKVNVGCTCRDSSMALAHFLYQISAPSLVSLEVASYPYPNKDSTCVCLVEALTQLVDSLERRESLNVLKMSNLPFSERKDEHGDGEFFILPALRVLELEVEEDWVSDVFEDMVEARVGEGLEKVCLRVRSPAERLDVERLRNVKKEAEAKGQRLDLEVKHMRMWVWVWLILPRRF
ncbi:hypothetical protein VNI00_017494 [Paramarasmius palmivorus]|uniref:F-box domain-containing protein n=1 Tax=Paramarasmius palmivorus TaxID=297713 RepID=A0AAW0B6K6_9AGAR